MESDKAGTSFAMPDSYGHFKLSAGPVSLQESYNQPINVTKWTSEKTGLRVVLIDVEGKNHLAQATHSKAKEVKKRHTGPLCNLFATVATEIFDDSGCPHTLEQ